ncbi:MAG: hypothetical protein P4L43_03755 [Syntrophobacteraceae bacterium]|nr:hypothetical protein [Syntrophobacteraceae bacterium]
MILEFLEYLMSSCSKTGRSMGFLSSSMRVRARFRRCKRVWAPHMEKTRHVILEAARQCPCRRRAAVLGAGLLHDIPLKELSALFTEVILVDIVHPWLSRICVRRFRNVTQISADITGVMEQLQRLAPLRRSALPVSHPALFVDDCRLDLTLSVNLLSQLGHVPGRYLRGLRDETTVAAFQKHLIEAHLEYLQRLPGRTVLITDIALQRITRDEHIAKEWDPLHGLRLPPADLTWQWHLAPSPEMGRKIDMYTTVAAYTDWKKSAQRIKND